MPQNIARLQALLDSQNDPSSLMWVGQMTQGDYIAPRLLQLAQVHAVDGKSPLVHGVEALSITNGEHSNPGKEARMVDGREIILPQDITVGASGKHVIDDDESDCPKKGEGRCARVGPHWFEVVPRNKVHNQLMDVALA